MTTKSIATVAGEIVELLEPLSSEDRHRVVKAAWALLGEVGRVEPTGEGGAIHDPVTSGSFSGKGTHWMKQNGVSSSHLTEVFHFKDAGADVIIAEMPGATNKDKVRNTYMLLGLSNFLTTGESTVADKAGRALCEKFGIYDHTNHAKAFKGGNELTGSAKSGWTVTSPGLRHAANLVKQTSRPHD